MNIEDQRKEFDKIAMAIQDKLYLPEVLEGDKRFHKRFKAFQFEEKIRCIGDKVNTHIPVSNSSNGWYGRQVCECAKTYLNRRYLLGEFWNYNTLGIFDGRTVDGSNALEYYVKDHPEPGLGQQPITRPVANIIDCSTYVGLVLRGIDYAHSPYALNSNKWDPDHPSTGIRKLTSNSDASWKNNLFDYQPALPSNSPLGYHGCSTARTAASIANLYSYLGNVIYDSDIDGALLPSNGNFHTCTNVTVSDRGSLFNLLEPGDLIFLANMAWYNVEGKKVTLSKLGLALKTGIPNVDDVIKISYINGVVSFTCNNTSLEFYKWSTTKSGLPLNDYIDPEPFKEYCNDKEGYYEFTANYSQPRRFKNISHVAFSSENPRYMYEVTTLEKTFYYRDLLSTSNKAMPRFATIRYIIRPQYGASVNVPYIIPQNENLVKFPWTFSRTTSDESVIKDEHGNIISTGKDYNGLKFKMMTEASDGSSRIGIWGTSTDSVYNTLNGTALEDYTYNKLTLTPGTYAVRISAPNDNVKLQILHNGTTNDIVDNIKNSSGQVSFNLSESTDVCVRIAVVGSGKTFGSGSGDSKNYDTITFYLKKIS